ncbi:MAG: FprA family A-type flavoprotein, partial [Ruminococcus sp.]|nr:FprA family A-type flavoprotein [Ruminococcus sp.]
QWLSNIKKELGDAKPDYLIVQHMEPDHSANIGAFVDAYPDAKIVGNAKTFTMIKRFFGTDYADKQVVVKEGEILSLGTHELKFVFAPMVHWPEVMMTYDMTAKVFFTADAFGKFGALDIDAEWACEARRYYFGIVGKYGMQVQALLKKASALDIETICPLHGPVLSEDLGYYLDLYNTWSSYGVESEGLFIAYTSVYGNTKKAALLLKEKLEAKGCPKVAIADLAREDMAESVEDAFRYGKLVLATTTYNADIFPFMREFINDLTERGYQNRTIGIIENGTWAPMAAKVIKSKFEKSKNITFTDTTVTVNSALDAAAEAQIEALAEELLK